MFNLSNNLRKNDFQEALHVRLKAVHIINASSIVDKMLTLMKPFISKEIFELVHIHTKMETLYPFVPQELLPDEFGGKAGSLKELQGLLI